MITRNSFAVSKIGSVLQTSASQVEQTEQYHTTAVLTVPNILSFIRLAGVPLFLWLVLVPRTDVSDIWAVIVLMLASLTDLLDGRIARALKQVSRLGQMLDPIADRLYILAIVIALGIRELLPWWLVIVLLARDVMLVGLVPLLRRYGYTSLPVNFIGKAATFMLLVSLPLILLGAANVPFSVAAKVLGWAAGLWGVGMYWWAGFLYVKQAVNIAQTSQRIDPRRTSG